MWTTFCLQVKYSWVVGLKNFHWKSSISYFVWCSWKCGETIAMTVMSSATRFISCLTQRLRKDRTENETRWINMTKRCAPSEIYNSTWHLASSTICQAHQWGTMLPVYTERAVDVRRQHVVSYPNISRSIQHPAWQTAQPCFQGKSREGDVSVFPEINHPTIHTASGQIQTGVKQRVRGI